MLMSSLVLKSAYTSCPKDRENTILTSHVDVFGRILASVKVIFGVVGNPHPGSLEAPHTKCRMSATVTSSRSACVCVWGGGGGDASHTIPWDVSIARCSYIPAHSITYSVQLRMRDSSIVRLLLPGAEYSITNESSR